MNKPATPIEFSVATTDLREHLKTTPVSVSADVVERLRAICEIHTDVDSIAQSSRDWWPIAMHWALKGEVPKFPSVICKPKDTQQVADILRTCNVARIPVTTAGGRSGVCGAAVPVFGGVVLDTTRLAGIKSVDTFSGVVEVLPGTFGPELETTLQGDYGLTVGHFPQSFDISTVGGWVACRGAGQYSTRYGKIEDMVVGLEVVLANGSIIRTGGVPAAADGPDLTQLFVGSEGQFGVITNVWLRTHTKHQYVEKSAFGFKSFSDGINAIRAIIKNGAHPAVLRLYDASESKRSYHADGTTCVLLVLDEGEPAIVEAMFEVVRHCVISAGGFIESAELVDKWLEHRNDTTALQSLTKRGFVVDTMEVSAPWSKLTKIFDSVRNATLNVPNVKVATCHLSHSYDDGACLYFTFAAAPPTEQIESTYIEMWNAAQNAALDAGSNLSHHHGVGLNRARFVARALGESLNVTIAIKNALDPNGILNPGKGGIPSALSTDKDEYLPW